ncbi:hypothetical protein P7E05_10160 [Enterococcus gallinarum]|uniref:hypothetical protein n=1 Tax=Enterococcus gallinarum TaxID=1353 RepID=UPI00288EF503|nr:hypothetical protein [Enterococcus gallinarum]MDT2708713.1 hypothetical protein [Enterococcus gallinarum]MDT2717893.1 hypothetical protein [Enterococcus gallinarum]
MVSSWVEGKEGVAEHLVYLNKEGKELQKLLAGEKNAIIRGAAGRKSPLGGRAKVGDRVYFVETGGDLLVTHRGMIENVIETEKMTPEESQQFVKQHQSELNLSKKQMERWAGKKFLAIYRIAELEAIEPFTYQRGKNMDDWVITSSIEEIK